jgi:hypothetical protein
MNKWIVFFLLIPFSVFAGDFTGTVRYEIAFKGDGLSAADAMLPKAYVVSYGKTRTKIETIGGLSASITGDIITDANTNTTYMVNHLSKTVNIIKEEPESADGGKAKDAGLSVKKLKDKGQILGYPTQKYEVNMKSADVQDLNGFIWTTTAIQPSISTNKIGMVRIPSQSIEGFMLKYEAAISVSGMRFTMTLTASEINAIAFDEKYFSIPDTYKKEEGLPALMRLSGME